MSNWGRDSEQSEDWREYAAIARDDFQKPVHRDPRYWVVLDYLMAGVLGICTAYVIWFVVVPFVALLRHDGVLQ